jgi:hypothetical protein
LGKHAYSTIQLLDHPPQFFDQGLAFMLMFRPTFIHLMRPLIRQRRLIDPGVTRVEEQVTVPDDIVPIAQPIGECLPDHLLSIVKVLNPIVLDRSSGDDGGAEFVGDQMLDPNHIKVDFEIRLLFKQNVGRCTSAEEARVSSGRHNRHKAQLIAIGVKALGEGFD